MRFHISVLSVLTVLPLAGLATSLASSWDDVRVMHAWEAVPDNWESLGPPHSNTTIDLFVALKAHNENALIDALYEVSPPGHPKYASPTLLLLQT
jgi:tripeptidyl-peptidase-1